MKVYGIIMKGYGTMNGTRRFKRIDTVVEYMGGLDLLPYTEREVATEAIYALKEGEELHWESPSTYSVGTGAGNSVVNATFTRLTAEEVAYYNVA
jgi:hypothetical protein